MKSLPLCLLLLLFALSASLGQNSPPPSAPSVTPSAPTSPTPSAPTPAAAPEAEAPAAPKPGSLSAEALEKMLLSLAAIEEQLTGAKNKKNLAALVEIEEALKSESATYAYWLKCKKQVDFDDKGKSGGEWADWKRSQEGVNADSSEYRTVLFLQLKWLALTIRASCATESSFPEIAAKVPAYLDEFASSFRKAYKFRGALAGSVTDSVFARFHKLDITLEERADWCDQPGDINGIYESIILPPLRKAKRAAELQAAWQKRIALLTDMVALEKRENDRNGEEIKIKFDEEHLPSLQWQMMRDVFQAGNEQLSGPAMLNHIKSHLAHPQASRWIVELTALLKHEELPPAGKKPEAPRATSTGPRGQGFRRG